MKLRNRIEVALFASAKNMSEEEIAEFIGEEVSNVKKGLLELQEYYENSDNSLLLSSSSRGWKMTVKEEYLPIIRKIVSDTELEKPLLETLAVVAWKRPILQSEVIKMRGTHAYDHIRELLEMKFISREKFGRSYKVKLAEKFYEYFDVEDEKEIREVFADVKLPEPELPKQIGELEVVNLQEEGKVGDLDIVDVPDPLEKWKVDHEELDELDRELEVISKRTDVHVKEIEKFKPLADDDEVEIVDLDIEEVDEDSKETQD